MKLPILLITILMFCTTVYSQEFDLSGDFSTNSNPNGVWSYGSMDVGFANFVLSPQWGTGWYAANHMANIWMNTNSTSSYGVPSGDVSLHPGTEAQPVVVRWTAPAEIGLAKIQIAGEFKIGDSGAPSLAIRRGGSALWSGTDFGTFDETILVEPGDTVDFCVYGIYSYANTPLDLTITTLEENLQLTTFSDFNHSYMISWADIPDWQFMRTMAEGTGTNLYATFYDDGIEWAAGGVQDMPFTVSTNTGLTSFRHFSKLGPGGSYYKDYGSSGLGFAYDTIASSGALSSFAFQYKVNAYQQGVNYPHMVTYDGEGTGTAYTTDYPVDTWLEFRADIDWSYQDADGKYGLFSLFVREGSGAWDPVSELQGIEMKIEDPSLITKLCAIVDASEDGYAPYLDDIRYSNGENPNLGTGTNLLVNGSIDAYQVGWRVENPQNTRRISYYQQVVELGFPEGSTGCVSQVVSLMSQGLSADDIDAGMYRAVFGGQLSQDGGDAFCGPYDGRVGVDFLDADEQLISSADTADYTGSGWHEMSATNPVPAQTRYIRYNYYSQGGMLNDATLSVLGLPMDDVALTVSSIHGSPVPTIGTSTNSWGTIVTCSVANVTSGTTRYECTGWTGTGSVPASGTSNSVEVTLTENSSISWNWQANYWLDVSVSGNGSVSHSDGWYTKDSEQDLVVTPADGWLFMGWSGDASGTNNAFVTMNAPKSVIATFSDDADGDGLLNSNETAIGSNPWKTDTDGDGFDDKTESDYGLSPITDSSGLVDYIQNNSSTFGLYTSNAILDVAVGQVALGIEGTTARLRLQVEQSEDLITWTNAGDVLEWTLPVGGEKQFLRVRSAP